mgnify:CR=1 FL=1
MLLNVSDHLIKKMVKAKNLNGLPRNLAFSHLSTLGYYDGGYMADWINYIAIVKILLIYLPQLKIYISFYLFVFLIDSL